MRKILGYTLWLAGLLFFFSNAWAERQVTDQLGRTVTIPDHVNRVVVLQHQTLNLLVQLDAQNSIVGILSSWKKQLGEHYVRLAPRLVDLPMPGDLTQVNIESLLKLSPQVVFVANYAPAEMITQIEQAGIPVVAISLREDRAGEANKINPTMTDEDTAYNNGLKTGIRLIGEVVDRQKQAQELIDYTFSERQKVSARLQTIAPENRIRVYMAKEGANKQVISSQADSLIKISRIWADFFPQTHRISLFRLFFPPFLALFPVFTEISPTDVSFGPPETGWPG